MPYVRPLNTLGTFAVVPTTGSSETCLIVLRGNSASGKSTVARSLREAMGYGTAWIEQDHIRRVLLREPDKPNGANIGLIDQTARYALDHGYTVILEGILDASRYGDMLRRLAADHLGPTLAYYFDVDFDETVRRHRSRPQSQEFGPQDMAGWYSPLDLVDGLDETRLTKTATAADVIQRILDDAANGQRHGSSDAPNAG